MQHSVDLDRPIIVETCMYAYINEVLAKMLITVKTTASCWPGPEGGTR